MSACVITLVKAECVYIMNFRCHVM